MVTDSAGNVALLDRKPVKRVQQALSDAGRSTRVQSLTETARTAQDAAQALGVPVGAIVKTLAFDHQGQIVLALIAGDRRCDLAALQQLLRLAAPLDRAKPNDVKGATGFTIGGVAPVGHSEPLPMAIDTSLARFERVFAAAGHPHCVFETSFGELQMLTGALPSSEIATH